MNESSQPQGVFITGTDTEVGKTMVAGGLAGLLRENGFDVGVMKPAETGCALDEAGTLIPSDAQFLQYMSGSSDPLELIVPYRFKELLAPAVAADLEGINLDIHKAVRCFEEISRRHEFIVVEGAGGLLVPLSREFLMLDLIILLKLPVVIVSRASLGTINHTLLTVRCAQTAKVPVAGIVINNVSPGKNWAIKTNPEVIARLSGIPVWGVLPYQKNIRPHQSCDKKVVALIRKHVNLKLLYALTGNRIMKKIEKTAS